MNNSLNFEIPRHYKRTMVFVDGSNFLIEFAKELKVDFRADNPPPAAIAAVSWLISSFSTNKILDMDVIRSYWFSSYQENENDGDIIREILRQNYLEPVIFKKKKGREKCVDIALTIEMLVNAFNKNFDVCLLISGDEDYIPLVKEVKRYGPRVWVSFFSSHGLSNSLRIAADMFLDILKDSNAANNPSYLKAREELFEFLKSPKNVVV